MTNIEQQHQEFMRKLKQVQDAVISQNPRDAADYNIEKLAAQYEELSAPLWESMSIELKDYMSDQWDAMKSALASSEKHEAANIIRDTLGVDKRSGDE